MSYILAVDINSSYSQASIYDMQARSIRIVHKGGIENLDADFFTSRILWDQYLRTIRQAVVSANVAPGKIKAIGIQQSTPELIFWDRYNEDQPIIRKDITASEDELESVLIEYPSYVMGGYHSFMLWNLTGKERLAVDQTFAEYCPLCEQLKLHPSIAHSSEKSDYGKITGKIITSISDLPITTLNYEVETKRLKEESLNKIAALTIDSIQ